MDKFDFEEFEELEEDEEFEAFLDSEDEEDEGFDGFLESTEATFDFDELAELDLGLEVAFDEAFRVFIEESAQTVDDYIKELRQLLEDAGAGDEHSV
jgi:hypothetical protein